MDITKLVDKLYALRQERLVAQKAVDALEAQEKDLRARLFDALKETPSRAAVGAVAKAEVKVSLVPSLVDPDAFLAWARRSPKRADCYKVSVVTPAWRAHVVNGETVDGVEVFEKEDLSLTKVK